MANRIRPIRIEFCVSDYEHRLIKNKMAQLGTHNMGAYLRKMAIDGYIIKVDYTEQKKLAAACREAGRDFTVVTQLLYTMERSPIPTRAEMSDIFNAVLDGAASLMLTGETAMGLFPVEAVHYLSSAAKAAQDYMKT